MSAGYEEFAERIARVNAAQVARYQSANRRPAHANWIDNLGYPGSVVIAFLVGGCTAVMARLFIYSLEGLPSRTANPDLVMAKDSAVALALGLILFASANAATRPRVLGLALGIWVSLISMHNAVHAYPAPWAAVFSNEWVVRIQVMTEPRSFYFRGTSYRIRPNGARMSTGTETPDIKVNRF